MGLSGGNSNPCLITALGASAGGLEALEKFFQHMPADAGIAFAIVQHLSPDHASALPQLLAKHTKMPVAQIREDTPVVPNHVYIIPPNATLTIKNGVLLVAAPDEPRGHRAPIDHLFRSLAEDRGENAVCIILSGTGSDGTLGLRAIKEHGGMAMAQTLESAKYDSILRSAIATGLVDHVLPVEDMPAKLIEYADYIRSLNGKPIGIRKQITDHLGTITGLLRRRAGHDFSQYKESTIARRIERRMKVLQVETVQQYVESLKKKPEEADLLFKDLLIGVTQFFRDPEAFDTLDREVIPKLFEDKGADDQVRVCVVGCASGEEAYSIAILLSEHASTLDIAPDIKIFATDIDERSLETARKGRYPASVAGHVSSARLERFFLKQDNAYQIKRELREMCIFSVHSFIKDPPFSRLDLISCRNVMIYLGPDLQEKIVPLFHYALRTGGYLFLGPSENTSSHRELFGAIDKKHRIFQKKQSLPRPVVQFPLTDIGRPIQSAGKQLESEERNLAKQLERIILQRYAPACVIVKENGAAVYFSGTVSRYLEQPTGSPDNNIVNMAREGLRTPLRAALHRVSTTSQRAVHRGVSVQTGGEVSRLNLTVEPLAEFQDAGLYVVTLEEAPVGSSPHSDAPVPDAHSDETIRSLEDELRSAQDHLQATVEELETSNEELRSANEEFQSTNQELGTAKEELQSINEELETVNAELNRKVADLDHSASDLQNLLECTQIATIFLDRESHIKSFTPAAAAMFRLIPGDTGRPITDLAMRFADTDLVEDINAVLKTLTPRERQLTAENGRYYQLRVLPYWTVHNVIEGVIVTFVDVTLIKQAEQLARDAQVYAESIVATVREPLLVLDDNLRVRSANRAFYDMFAVTANETDGQSFYELGHRRWDIPELRQLMSDLLTSDRIGEDFQVEYSVKDAAPRTMTLNARRIEHAKLILLAIKYVTAP